MQHLSSAGPVQRVNHVEQSSIIRLEVHYGDRTFCLSANLDDKGSVLMEQIKKEIGEDSKIKVFHSSKRSPVTSLLDKHLTLRNQSFETGDTLTALCGTLIGQLDRSSQLCKSSEVSILEKIRELSAMIFSSIGPSDGSSQLCKSSRSSFSFSAFSFIKLENIVFQEFPSMLYPYPHSSKHYHPTPISRPGLREGLILRGCCKVVDCDAYNEIIWIEVGLGKFSVQQLISKAQGVLEEIDNLGFLNCNYRIEGSLSTSEDGIPVIEGKTAERYLTTFQGKDNEKEENEKKVDWDYIEITTTRLV